MYVRFTVFACCIWQEIIPSGSGHSGIVTAVNFRYACVHMIVMSCLHIWTGSLGLIDVIVSLHARLCVCVCMYACMYVCMHVCANVPACSRVRSSDGMRLVSASMDKRLLLWDIESATRILSMSGHADDVYSCSFMPVCALQAQWGVCVCVDACSCMRACWCT